MDYLKLYNLLCNKGKNKRELYGYTEIHHIIPRCMGGTNDLNNLVTLTYREHFIAHHLLCKIFPKDSGIQYGFLCMLRIQPTGERILTARMVETIKRNFKKFKSWQCRYGYNPGRTENSRNKARERMLNSNPIKLNPEKNHTVIPVRVHFNNGTTRDYSMIKCVCKEFGIPSATYKWRRKHNKPMNFPHAGIIDIERLKI